MIALGCSCAILSEHALILKRGGFLERHTDHGDFQLAACFRQLRSSSFPLRAHAQVYDLGSEGTVSFMICRRFPQISLPASTVIPVMLPPGRVRLAANPNRIGSIPVQTIGIVPVAARCRRNGIGNRNDHVWVVADDLASEISVAFGPPIA